MQQMQRLVLILLACGCGVILLALTANQAGSTGSTTRPASLGQEVVRVVLPDPDIAECEPISRTADGVLFTRCGDRFTRVWVEVEGDRQRIVVVETGGGPPAAATPTPVPELGRSSR
jgi:hypothetical protein